MIVFLVLVIILLAGLTAAAVLGKIGGFMAEPTSSQSFAGVPSGLSANDIAQLRFDQALRGYRMDQVDEVIDALMERVRQLEAAGASHPRAPASEAGAPVPDEGAPVPDAGASLPEAGAPVPEEGSSAPPLRPSAPATGGWSAGSDLAPGVSGEPGER